VDASGAMTGHSLERDIEAMLRDRTGRECLFTPSGRVALWLALRSWLRPGDQLLMSPLTCDVVLFTVLAAGLRPVMAPLSLEDGNIDPLAVPAATWSRLGGVMTTNLYGLPDRVAELRSRCASLGIPLIEDAAQALETEVAGVAVGAFGDAAAFSFSKHAGAPAGGVLAFADGARRPDLERMLAGVTVPRSRTRLTADLLRPELEAGIRRLHLVRPARYLASLLGLHPRAASNRMPLLDASLRRALAAAPDLAALEWWVRRDRPGYRMTVPPVLLRRIVEGLRRVEEDRARRIEGVSWLRELPAVAPLLRRTRAVPLLAVPFLVPDREAARTGLRRRLVPVSYVFDPPLDDYAAADLVEPSPDPVAARWWAAHVLPVDPLHAVRALPALAGLELALPVSTVSTHL
jgi:DegT/DnrJ/EryC1/StrS aminotransferase family